MNTIIVWTAQYLLWLMVAGFAFVWLVVEDRRGKLDVAFQAVIGIAIMVVFLYLAKSLHHDPRPFVENPNITPLFQHSADDGFPSDHSLAAGLIATLVLLRRRPLGLLFAAAAVAIAWARVAAHVHHPQDVIAGLLLGALAAVLASIIVQHLVVPRLPRLRHGSGPDDVSGRWTRHLDHHRTSNTPPEDPRPTGRTDAAERRSSPRESCRLYE